MLGCWRGYLSGATCRLIQLMPLPLTVSCFSKIKIGLPFWYWLTWVFPDKGPLNVNVNNTVKTVNSRTVSTGQKDSKSTYNCPERYANEETRCTKTKHLKNDSCIEFRRDRSYKSTDTAGPVCVQISSGFERRSSQRVGTLVAVLTRLEVRTGRYSTCMLLTA